MRTMLEIAVEKVAQMKSDSATDFTRKNSATKPPTRSGQFSATPKADSTTTSQNAQVSQSAADDARKRGIKPWGAGSNPSTPPPNPMAKQGNYNMKSMLEIAYEKLAEAYVDKAEAIMSKIAQDKYWQVKPEKQMPTVAGPPKGYENFNPTDTENRRQIAGTNAKIQNEVINQRDAAKLPQASRGTRNAYSQLDYWKGQVGKLSDSLKTYYGGSIAK